MAVVVKNSSAPDFYKERLRNFSLEKPPASTPPAIIIYGVWPVRSPSLFVIFSTKFCTTSVSIAVSAQIPNGATAGLDSLLGHFSTPQSRQWHNLLLHGRCLAGEIAGLRRDAATPRDWDGHFMYDALELCLHYGRRLSEIQLYPLAAAA